VNGVFLRLILLLAVHLAVFAHFVTVLAFFLPLVGLLLGKQLLVLLLSERHAVFTHELRRVVLASHHLLLVLLLLVELLLVCCLLLGRHVAQVHLHLHLLLVLQLLELFFSHLHDGVAVFVDHLVL